MAGAAWLDVPALLIDGLDGLDGLAAAFRGLLAAGLLGLMALVFNPHRLLLLLSSWF